MRIITLRTKQNIRYENSLGICNEYKEVPMEYIVRLGKVSSFEMMSSDGDHYAEGSLEIHNGELVDYDGVFSLAAEVLYMLRREGTDVAEMQESLEITEEEMAQAQRHFTFYQVDYDTTKI